MSPKLSPLDRSAGENRSRVLGGGVAGSLGALAAYLRVIRPWQLRWGATDDEVARLLPGDDDVPQPSFNATRAVTITARPEEIWPWLIQIGIGRAGWYSYDWLDNLGHHSAERIMPEFQHLAVGDLIPISPDGAQGQRVKAFAPNHWMLWDDEAGDATWYWGRFPLDERQTRLITRVRMRYRWTSPMLLFNVLVEFSDIVMMRKCLLGIKRRAEAAAPPLTKGRSREMAEVGVTWVQGEQFVASGTGGHSIVLDAPGGRETWQGFKPSELLLAALAGCTAVDVMDILRKKRQRVSGLRVTAHGEQRADHPRAFERIAVHYAVRGQGVSAQAVERAINLSQEKYCSVAATLRGVATITTAYTITDEEEGEHGRGLPVEAGNAQSGGQV